MVQGSRHAITWELRALTVNLRVLRGGKCRLAVCPELCVLFGEHRPVSASRRAWQGYRHMPGI